MFVRLVEIAVAVLALVLGSAAHATPLVYGSYYDENLFFVCSSNSCRLEFAQLPSDKLLMVTKISCSAVNGGPVLQATLRVSATAGGSFLPRFLLLSLPQALLFEGKYYTNFREDTRYLIGQGRFPSVNLALGGVGSGTVTCTLVGDLVSPL
jgi:hypothetical protein